MEVGGLIGLLFGVILGIIVWFIGRKRAIKKREHDEVNEHIWKTARSYSWYTTLITIYILLLLALLGLITSIVKALSILLIVHLFSWAIAGAYCSSSLYYEEEADRRLYRILLSYFIVLGIVFVTLTIFFL